MNGCKSKNILEMFDQTNQNDIPNNDNENLHKIETNSQVELDEIIDEYIANQQSDQCHEDNNKDNNEDNKENEDNNDEKETQKNELICRIIKVHFSEFYDDIYVPFKFFKNGDWKIGKILYDNEDVLFYHDDYLTENDKERFHDIFSKYVIMIEEILSTDNKLYCFLEKWTNTTGLYPKSNLAKSHLRNILNNTKYHDISPAHIAKIYWQISKKYNNDGQSRDKINSEVINYLDDLVLKIKKEKKKFTRIHHEIVYAHVYEQPIDYDPKSAYSISFINCIIMAILDCAERLINLNVYTIHTIINEIIDDDTPLQMIYQHDPKEYGGRKMIII